MASAVKHLEDNELISYILTGVDADYNPVVTTIGSRVEPISTGELYMQLISFEQRMDLQNGGGQQHSANMAAKGGHGGNPSSGRGRGRGGGCGNGHGGGRGQGGASYGAVCQLCGKEGIPCYVVSRGSMLRSPGLPRKVLRRLPPRTGLTPTGISGFRRDRSRDR